MATDLTVTSTSYGGGGRPWLIGEHGANMPINAVLDWSTFTGTNFADGTVKSGCVVGRITASGKYGPYDNTASDGRETAVGLLFNGGRIPANTATVSSDAVLVHCHVRAKTLPYESGAGAYDSNAQADLRLVYVSE